jgi:hypothetical protein
MRTTTWEIDDHTVVEAKLRTFGKSTLSVNGVVVSKKLGLRGRDEIPVNLSGGRRAYLKPKRQYGSAAVLELRVDGRLIVENQRRPIKCAGCQAAIKPNDRFCAACGAPTPAPETYAHRKNVDRATQAIWTMAALYLFSGVAVFFLTRSKLAPMLSKLIAMNPSQVFPKTINGVTYTVAALRREIAWETEAPLLIYGVLAAIMAALAVWGRRAPLPAVLIAGAVYVVVIILGAITDPATIGQGIYVKFLIIAILIRGVRGGLALRTPAIA